MWDNHEFSWQGWQSLQVFDGTTRPQQTRKVAAMQAWFEFQPARVRKASGPGLERFDPPKVVNAPIAHFDAQGLGQEPNNLPPSAVSPAIAPCAGAGMLSSSSRINAATARKSPPAARRRRTLTSKDFPELFPQEALEILDAGRIYNGRKPPDTIPFGE